MTCKTKQRSKWLYDWSSGNVLVSYRCDRTLYTSASELVIKFNGFSKSNKELLSLMKRNTPIPTYVHYWWTSVHVCWPDAAQHWGRRYTRQLSDQHILLLVADYRTYNLEKYIVRILSWRQRIHTVNQSGYIPSQNYKRPVIYAFFQGFSFVSSSCTFQLL